LHGGEIIVPKLPSFKLTHLAHAVNPDFTFETKGIQQGERLHEQLIGDTEAYEKIEVKDFYILISPFWKGNMQDYLLENQAMLLPGDFSYTTENCGAELSEEELCGLTEEYLFAQEINHA
jgi:UDP-N-acetylglucosamine 4,6-dehydratase